MADANLANLAYIVESTWDEIPAGTITDLNITGESFGHNIEHIESNVIRSDRQTVNLIRTGAEASGGFDFELAYGTPPDDLLAGALWDAWVGVGTLSTETIVSGATASGLDFSLDATANTITLGASVAHAIVAGQWIKLTGSSADDGYHLVTSVVGQVLTVESITTTEILDETDAATITGSRLRNGVTEKSFAFERKLEMGTTDQYFAYRGQVCDTFSLTLTANSIITGSLGFIGGTIATTDLKQSAFGTGANNAAPSTDSMNAVTNVANIREGGSAVSSDLLIQEISFQLSKNVRGKKAIGVLGNADIGGGKCQITGSLNAIFNDDTLYDKFLAGTETSISFKCEDDDNKAYIFDFPRVKFSSDDGGKIPGSDQDVMENLSWTAIRHATYNCMMQICRFNG